jgi:hypothetical protein
MAGFVKPLNEYMKIDIWLEIKDYEIADCSDIMAEEQIKQEGKKMNHVAILGQSITENSKQAKEEKSREDRKRRGLRYFSMDNSGVPLSFLYQTGLLPIVKIDPDMGMLRLTYVRQEPIRVKKPFLWGFDPYNYNARIKRNKRGLQVWSPLFRKVTSFAADSTIRMIEKMKSEFFARTEVSIDSARRESELITERKAVEHKSFLGRKEVKRQDSVPVIKAIVSGYIPPEERASMAALEASEKDHMTSLIRERMNLLKEKVTA